MIGMSVCADQEAHILELVADLVERPLELDERTGLVHTCIHQHDSRAGLNGPGIAMGHAGPRQRKAKPPQTGDDALSATPFAAGALAPPGLAGALTVWRGAATLHRRHHIRGALASVARSRVD